VGRGSLVSWVERVSYERSLVYVWKGEVSWSGTIFLCFGRKFISRQILQKDTKKDCGKTKKRARQIHVMSRNSENHTFLRKNMQTRISTEPNRGNYCGLDPG